MNKAHSLKNWENYPSVNTPVNAQNLNELDRSVDVIDDRVIALDEIKVAKLEISTLFENVEFDQKTGIITFTRKNGATVTIDTPMEKIQTGIYYDPVTEMLTLPLIDGTTIGVDLSRLITEYEFLDSDTIAFSVSTEGKITAIIKEGSIEERHLRPDYLAEVKVEVAKAKLSREASEKSAKESESYAHGGTGTRDGEETDNSEYFYNKSKEIYDNFSSAGNVTGVKGNNEAAYRAGNVNITSENIGLGNVGNYKAVSTVSSQDLTDLEKANARGNINAIGVEVDEGYCGIVNPTGTNALWIRTPLNGLLPAKSGTNSNIGSAGWHFKNAYIDYVSVINAICTGAIQYKGSKSTNNMIRFLDNSTDAYGNGISISGGGMTIVGGGESASACENLIDNPGTEELWLTSDGMIHFYTNCNTIANKAGVILDNLRNLYPEGPATTYAGSLGTDTNKWLNVYTQNLNGTALNTNGQASTSGKGVVQLSDSTGSTSTALAATANAVKKAMDGKSFSHLDKYGTATMSVSSVFSAAKEIIVHVYATDANSNRVMYTWAVAPGAIGTEGVHLLSGYQSGSYGGLAEVTLTRDTAKIEHLIVANTELAAKATMRISYR